MPKVFLSPSNQYDNAYAWGDTTEGVQCGRIAAYCKAALERCGVDVVLMHDESMQEKCAMSDKVGADLHVPIHTNAFNGVVRGTRMFCFNQTGKGKQACEEIYNLLAPFSIGTSDNIQINTKLYEIRAPKAPTAYIECEFHDSVEGAKWIVNNAHAIGEMIAHGICNYFGIAYFEEPTTLYKVQVGAYAFEVNAEKMLAKLKAAGFAGYIKTERS